MPTCIPIYYEVYVLMQAHVYVKLMYIHVCTCMCRFILRNHILQTAIEHAENGDFSEVHVYITCLLCNMEASATCVCAVVVPDY